MHPSLALLYHITATPINITLSLRNILLQTGHLLLNMLLLLNCSRISHKWHQASPPTTVSVQCNEIPWCSLLHHMENEACNRVLTFDGDILIELFFFFFPIVFDSLFIISDIRILTFSFFLVSTCFDVFLITVVKYDFNLSKYYLSIFFSYQNTFMVLYD